MMQFASTSSRPGPCCNVTADSSASADVATMHQAAAINVFIALPSHDLDVRALHDIVVIARGIEDEISRLGAAGAVERPHQHGMTARARSRQCGAPLAPGVAAKVGAKR